MRIGLAVALVLAVLPATAGARTLKLHPLRAPVAAADGGRYVISLGDLSSSAVTLRDERTGERSTLDARNCDRPVMGGRWLVMSCRPEDTGWPPYPRVWDLAHPDRPPVDVQAQLPQVTLGNYDFTGVGRRWISVDVSDYHEPTLHGRIDRRTGRFVEGRAPGCSPRGRITDRGLFLHRCGSRRTLRLSHCIWSDCSLPVIAGGAVAWSENGRVRALMPATGVRRAWRVPEGPYTGYVAIVLSHRHVFVNGGWRGTLPGR